MINLDNFIGLSTKNKYLYLREEYSNNLFHKINNLPKITFYTFGKQVKYKINIKDDEDIISEYMVDQIPFIFKISSIVANLYNEPVNTYNKIIQIYLSYVRNPHSYIHFNKLLGTIKNRDQKLVETFTKLDICEKAINSLDITYCKFLDIYKNTPKYLLLKVEKETFRKIDTLTYINNFTPIFLDNKIYLIGSYNQNNGNTRKKIDLSFFEFNKENNNLNTIFKANRLVVIRKYQTSPADQNYSYYLLKDKNEIYSIKNKLMYIIQNQNIEKINKIILYDSNKHRDLFIIKGKNKVNKEKLFELIIEDIKNIYIEEITNEDFVARQDVIFQLGHKIYLPKLNPHTLIPLGSPLEVYGTDLNDLVL